jgi:hypothetical protein
MYDRGPGFCLTPEVFEALQRETKRYGKLPDKDLRQWP